MDDNMAMEGNGSVRTNKASAQVGRYSLLWLAMFAPAAMALEGTAYVGGATEYTSNSLQSPVDEQSDVALMGLGGVDLQHTEGNVDFNARYGLEYSTYQDDTQGDETAVNGESQARWSIRPETLSWDFRHSASRIKGTSSGVDTNDTRTTQNLLATGPRSLIRFSQQDYLSLGAQAMKVNTTGATENDSDRLIGNVGYQHLTSEIQSFGLQASQQKVSFDAEAAPDITFSQAALTWDRAYRLGRMQLSAGRNSSEREGFDTVYGELLQAYVDYDNTGHRVSVAAVNELTDSMMGLDTLSFSDIIAASIDSSGNFNPSLSNLDVIDVVENSRLEINYSTTRMCERCQPRLQLAWDDQDYLEQPLDQKVFRVLAGLGYSVTERLSASIALSRDNQEYIEEPSRTDDLTLLRLGASYKASPSLTFDGFIAQESRDSDVPENEYDELLARLGFRYFFINR